jgi:hypothetical protein
MGSWQAYALGIDLDYTLPPVEHTAKYHKLTPGTYRMRVDCEPGDVEWSFHVREYTRVQLAPDNPLVPTN